MMMMMMMGELPIIHIATPMKTIYITTLVIIYIAFEI